MIWKKFVDDNGKGRGKGREFEMKKKEKGEALRAKGCHSEVKGNGEWKRYWKRRAKNSK